MNTPMFNSVNEVIHALAVQIRDHGAVVAPRGMRTREVFPIGVTLINPRNRLLTIRGRKWDFRLAVGELCWHLSGSDDANVIGFYQKRWREVSDDGRTITGSCYGKKIFSQSQNSVHSQWQAVLELLQTDPETRRAVIHLGGDEHVSSLLTSRDIACTTSIQFVIRSGALHAFCYMRSNDLIWGAPYDMFIFTMLQELMAKSLAVELGTYTHFVGSMHAYERHSELVRTLAAEKWDTEGKMPEMEGLEHVGAFLSAEKVYRERGLLQDLSSPYWDMLLKVVAGKAQLGFVEGADTQRQIGEGRQ